MDEPPRDGADETHRASLRTFLHCRYWGRALIFGVVLAIGLGLIDALVPILNWQLALVALCLVVVLAVGTRDQLLGTLAVLFPATGLQLAMLLDRPGDPQRAMIFVFSLSLTGFVLYVAGRRAPAHAAPRRVVLNLADGRQIPLLVGQLPPETGGGTWQAVSGNGPVYLADGWTVTHAGSRRAVVEPVIYHDEQGRAYVPDLHGLRDSL